MLCRVDSLKSRFFFFAACFLLALTAACAPAANGSSNFPFIVTVSPEVPTFSPVLPSPQAAFPEPLATEPLAAETATLLAPSPSPVPSTSTAAPTLTPSVPTPTETLLPQLELPTERSNAPALVPWTGLPTYPGDSDPGLLFRLDYDPDLWAQTEGNFGDIVLGNRLIDYCTITPWVGRGLPMDWKVEHVFRNIGLAAFDVNTVTYQDVVKFVSYVGGDRRVLTGFQVSFVDQKEQCLQDAEAIFGTLRSFSAIPTSTPAASATP